MRQKTIAAIALAGALLVASTAAASTTANMTTNATKAFPVAVKSADGTVDIASRPRRILSLSASSTEMLYAIGAGTQVVGVDKYSAYPPNAPHTSFTGYETNAEDYLPLHPDLVILAFNTGSLIEQLEKLHIPTLLLPPTSTIAGAESQIDELGAATGHDQGARASIASVNSNLDRTVSAAGHLGNGATYYIEIDPTYYSATSATFIGAVFSRFKMVNIADAAKGSGSSYPQLSAEYIIKANPDFVFLADTVCCKQSATTFAKRPGFSTLRAVRLHHVIGVNDSVASQWGPHSLESFTAVIANTLIKASPDTKS